MTAAKEKAIREYLESIPPDEDRKGMIGYRFLGILPRKSRRVAKTAAKRKSKASGAAKRSKK